MTRHRRLARIAWRVGRVHLQWGTCFLMVLASGAGLQPAVPRGVGAAVPRPPDEPAIPGRPVRAAGTAVVDFRQLIARPQPVTGPTEVVIPFLPQVEAPSAGGIIPPTGSEAG